MQLGSIVVITCFLLCLFGRGNANPSKRREDETHFLEDRLKGNEDAHSHHEQFIGEEEAEMFDQLPPHVAKKLLGKVVDKIDQDKDGLVSRDELITWIEQLTYMKVHDNADFRWHKYVRESKDIMTWDEYLIGSWGVEAKEGKGLEDISDSDRGWTLQFVIEREKRRWDSADADEDNALSFEEFKSFIEPHAFSHMKQIVIAEAMDDLDKNHDHKLSLEEYFDYVLRGQDKKAGGFKTLQERYREDFSKNRDLNKDGSLSKEEFGYWVFPEGFHRPRSECNFLFQKADHNSDDMLSRKEIIDNHDVFVGSSVTDYGEILKKEKKRDEL